MCLETSSAATGLRLLEHVFHGCRIVSYSNDLVRLWYVTSETGTAGGDGG